ncbi:hypothetical protein pb186bvf_015841 [Paramecium bursaria]
MNINTSNIKEYNASKEESKKIKKMKNMCFLLLVILFASLDENQYYIFVKLGKIIISVHLQCKLGFILYNIMQFEAQLQQGI